jgi:hypothetical protein
MRKFAAAAVMLALLAGPAFAQGKKGAGPNTELKRIDEEQQKRNKQLDKEYNETMKRTRSETAPPYDPWGNVRPPAKK